MSTIGERIRKRRKEKRLTLEALAQAVGTSKQTIQRYESGVISHIPFDKVEAIAEVLDVQPAHLLGWDREIDDLDRKVLELYPGFVPGQNYVSDFADDDAIPSTGLVPVVEGIAAGLPVLAEENIIDYMPVTVRNPNEYFALVVRGESMIGAGIPDGCKVLIHMQSEAEDGQIVACRVNGDEATLKRFKQKGDMVFLMPENKDFEPYIVPVDDFIRGDAEIIGVVKQVIIDTD